MLGEGSLQQLCSYLDRGMPGKAKREKDRKWKLARKAAWDFLPASLLREAPAVWVPGIDLVPSGEDVPYVLDLVPIYLGQAPTQFGGTTCVLTSPRLWTGCAARDPIFHWAFSSSP